MDASTKKYPANANQGYNQQRVAPAEGNFSERTILNITNLSAAILHHSKPHDRSFKRCC